MTNFMGINGIARPKIQASSEANPVEVSLKWCACGQFFGMSEYGHYLKGRYFEPCMRLISKRR